MQYKDYYKIMGLERTASADDIKRAYRKLARKYHPDVSKEKDAEERFKELGEAYEVLRDPEKRAAYDQLGSNWQAGQSFKPPPEWDTSDFSFAGGGYTDSAQFSDFFESLFGGGGRSQQHYSAQYGMPGQDLHTKIAITLEEAYQGTVRTIQLQVPELDKNGMMHHRLQTFKVKIPAGVTPGQQVRLAGQGAPGMGGGPKGDLYLEVEFQSSAQYRIEGHDIYSSLLITPWEAALGATVVAPTLGGTVEVKIPPGSQSGQKMRLKGRGLPGKQTGDHYLQLQMMTPPADTDARREFYQKMAQEFAFNPRERRA